MKSRPSKGFTLVEFMIAALIMSLVLGGTVMLAMQMQNNFQETGKEKKVVIIPVKEELEVEALRIAQILRDSGLIVEFEVMLVLDKRLFGVRPNSFIIAMISFKASLRIAT